MGFAGVHRASVGLEVPGASILPLLSGERVQSGVATGTITRLGPFDLHKFDYFCFVLDHGRRFVDFEQPPRDT